jgi:hypothetical protein
MWPFWPDHGGPRMSIAARTLLAELSALGIRVTAEGAYLRLVPSAPPDLRARVVAAKPELIALLTERDALDQGLACREVLGFPASLLAELPIPTSLVLARPDGTTSMLPASSSRWSAMHSALPGSTVGAVLAHHGFVLRAVVIEGCP